MDISTTLVSYLFIIQPHYYHTRYLGAEGGIIAYILSAFYWSEEENNIVDEAASIVGDDDDIRPFNPTYNYRVMLFTLATIAVWMLIARYMFHKKIFIKI
eukprot:m.82829 g.82829  ORF g.82829 m.82829 type:complete len:100 (+) comp8677_c0_seq3:3274-3573(+)